jgi:polysaccharide biosynthesis protein PslG
MGAAVDRLELRWDQLEPSPGIYDFTALDDTLAMNDQIGFSVLAVVDGTPSWATPGTLAPGNAPPIGLDQPVFLAGGDLNPTNPWAGFLATVAARYGTRIRAWEIWNEPNSNVFWNGTPDQYARLLAVAQTVLAKAAPAAPVLVGGMVSDDGAFLGAVAAARCAAGPCAGVFSPAVAWHVYDNPADIVRLASLTRRLLQAYTVTPEVWITEANVPVDDPQAPDDAIVGQDAVSLNRQAAFVLQAYTLARLAGVRTLVIYRASDVDDQGHYWGLLRNDGSARPALLAYRTAAQWLGGTRAMGLGHPLSGVSIAQFCGDGKRVAVAWNDTTARVNVAIPASAASAVQVDATGVAQALTAAQGAWQVSLPPATAATAFTVALGRPTLVVQADGC